MAACWGVLAVFAKAEGSGGESDIRRMKERHRSPELCSAS